MIFFEEKNVIDLGLFLLAKPRQNTLRRHAIVESKARPWPESPSHSLKKFVRTVRVQVAETISEAETRVKLIFPCEMLHLCNLPLDCEACPQRRRSTLFNHLRRLVNASHPTSSRRQFQRVPSESAWHVEHSRSFV